MSLDETNQRSQLAALDYLEQAFQRQMEPFLERVKQMTLEIVDEVGQKHGNSLFVQVRGILLETVGGMLKTEVAARLDKLRPAIVEGSDAVRNSADHLLKDMKQFITKTVVDVFQIHVPNYSSRAGRRMIDYFLAGTLLCLAAVLLFVGGILGLKHFDMPDYLAYLIGGAGALAVGMIYLKVRARKWRTQERDSGSPGG
jgi:hypothetical protein